MTLDDLRIYWRDEMTNQSRFDERELRAIETEVAQLARAVAFRDFWFVAAYIAAGGLGTFFVLLNSEYFEPVTIIGVLWFLASAAVATATLVWARSIGRERDWTLLGRFEHEIKRLQRQRWLLDHVHYWLLGPLAVGVALGGMLRAGTGSLPWGFYGLCIVLIAVTYWLCRRDAARKFGPLLERMQALHRDLTST